MAAADAEGGCDVLASPDRADAGDAGAAPAQDLGTREPDWSQAQHGDAGDDDAVEFRHGTEVGGQRLDQSGLGVGEAVWVDGVCRVAAGAVNVRETAFVVRYGQDPLAGGHVGAGTRVEEVADARMEGPIRPPRSRPVSGHGVSGWIRAESWAASASAPMSRVWKSVVS
ncbi:hypothetical protein ACFU76_14845 [Streptomyces sp. NPDC057539]|uniref:hypothetical protein n=1 Tax=Streptomyces sp. NPDC057539 TaxID=3346159 RepID=UPI0036809F63